MNEIGYEVRQESDGNFVAECLKEAIFTQSDNWEELRRNVKETVVAYYFGDPERWESKVLVGNSTYTRLALTPTSQTNDGLRLIRQHPLQRLQFRFAGAEG
jgi:hypothetical protein